MMKTILLLGLVLAAVATTNYEKEFLGFVSKYNKVYADDNEASSRFEIFKTNLDMIQGHNEKKLSWTLAVNEWADLTWDEFSAGRLGYTPATTTKPGIDLSEFITVPTSMDWNSRGSVTGVKNQGQCGSCWSFSTTGSIEGAIQIKTGRLYSLSEQMLVDCDTAGYNKGCNGGTYQGAFEYIQRTGGLCGESSYPYTGESGTCKSYCSKVSTIKGYQNVASSSEGSLLAAATQGPVSVAIEADQQSFQFYSSGVMSGYCGTNLDHAVLLTGYGVEQSYYGNQQYWIVKNSWGSQWGDRGYIRLAMGMNYPHGQCGIAMDAAYPIA